MRYFWLIMALAVGVQGQTTITGEQIYSIKKFGGLNTRSSDFEIAPNEFRQLDGFDLHRNLGSLTKRFGYDDQGTIAGADSIIGIFGAYFSDGRQRLFYVVDSTGVGWGEIRTTPFNSVSGTQTQVKRKWPIISKPKFAIFQDKVFVVNGNGRGIIYDNKSARDFPPYAPGEPTVIPLKTSGNLHGEYVYVFKYRDTTGSNSFQNAYFAGNPTERIKVDSGQVLLENFTWITGGNWDTTPETTQVRIYRTKANPGILDEGDTAYWVGTDITATSKANMATKSFTDNIADGSLNTDSFVVVVNLKRVGGNTGNGTYPRYGSPWGIGDGNRADSGIFGGMPKFLWGYAYVCAYLDTVHSMESVISPPFYFGSNPSSSDSIMLGIPNPPTGFTGYKINLYRSAVVYARWDTTWQTIDLPSGNPLASITKYLKTVKGRNCRRFPDGSLKCYLSEQSVYDPGGKKDSVYNLGQYFLLAQLNIGDTSYVDTIRYDSLTSNLENLYDVSVPLSPMENIVSLEDRMFASYGSTVAISDLDSASRWFIFNRASVSAQDGQRITSIWGQRQSLRIGKTESLHNFYQTSDTIWNLSEVSHHFGVIAPHSVAQGFGGTYYYTDYGVMRETEGEGLERQYGVVPISQKIAALDTLPMSKKEDAVGIYHKQMYMLSLPQLGDSGQTYVYFEKADAWTRWPNLCFGGATHYSTETNLSFLPGDTLYFFKPGGTEILRFGVQEVDDVNTPIRVRARSAPMFTQDMNLIKRVNRVGLIANATLQDSLTIHLEDEEGNQVASGISFLDLRTKYQVEPVDEAAIGRYLIYVLTNGSGDWTGDTRIEGIELFWNISGQ